MSFREFEINMGGVMHGLSVLGGVTNPQVGSHLLQGHYDDYIRLALFHQQYEKLPNSKEDLYSEEMDTGLERIKFVVRSSYEEAMGKVSEDGEINAEPEQDTAKNVRESNQPHPKGTTAELAQQLELPKSKIRKMKREGTLDQYIADHLGENNEGHQAES